MRLLACLLLSACAAPVTSAPVFVPSEQDEARRPTPIGIHPRAAAWVEPPLPEGAVLRAGHANPHGAEARGGAFTPDGARFAWSDRHGIHIEDVATGERVRELDAPPFLALAFASDGSALIAIGTERMFRWDLADGTQTLDAALPDCFANAPLAVAPDGTTLAVGRYEGALVLVDPETAMIRATRQQPEGTVTALGYAADGTLVSMGDAGWARWSGESPSFHRTHARAHAVSPSTAAVAYDDGQRVIVADLDGQVRATLDVDLMPVAFSVDGGELIARMEALPYDLVVLDATTGAERTRLAAVYGTTAVSADGRTFTVGTTMFDLAEGARIPADAVDVTALGFSADGRQLYGTDNRSVYRWDVETGARQDMAGTGERVMILGRDELTVLDRDGKLRSGRSEDCNDWAPLDDHTIVCVHTDYSGDDPDEIRTWDLDTDVQTRVYRHDTDARVIDLTTTPDGRVYARTMFENRVLVVDPAAKQLVADHAPKVVIDESFGVRVDGTFVMNSQQKMYDPIETWERWDLNKKKRLAQSAPYDTSRATQWMQRHVSRDGSVVTYVDADKVLHVLETEHMQEIATLPCPSGHELALAPDGGLVAVQDADGSIVVYQLPL